mmetsp:Transcript_36935/g.102593  ORF Transcript_36935/g.102593 Transcript_36935/m.102593 type:complete len:333 (-) Transcript_36935:111-1109(-)
MPRVSAVRRTMSRMRPSISSKTSAIRFIRISSIERPSNGAARSRISLSSSAWEASASLRASSLASLVFCCLSCFFFALMSVPLGRAAVGLHNMLSPELSCAGTWSEPTAPPATGNSGCFASSCASSLGGSSARGTLPSATCRFEVGLPFSSAEPLRFKSSLVPTFPGASCTMPGSRPNVVAFMSVPLGKAVAGLHLSLSPEPCVPAPELSCAGPVSKPTAPTVTGDSVFFCLSLSFLLGRRFYHRHAPFTLVSLYSGFAGLFGGAAAFQVVLGLELFRHILHGAQQLADRHLHVLSYNQLPLRCDAAFCPPLPQHGKTSVLPHLSLHVLQSL